MLKASIYIIICVCVRSCAQSLSCVQLFVTPWTVACQARLSMGILQVRILEWVAMPSSRGSSQPRSPTLKVDSLPSELQWKPNRRSQMLGAGLKLKQRQGKGRVRDRKGQGDATFLEDGQCWPLRGATMS